MGILSNENQMRRETVEIPFSAKEYPAALREIAHPPQILYALGNISLLKERKLAIVGSRRTPVNALKLGGEIAKALSEQLVVVTGTADGGDSAAIEGALSGSGRIICLLAGGFSALPQTGLGILERVLERGLLLAYQPFETPVRAYSYEERNRLLAYLSDGVFVLGAGEKSGALITAKYAKEGKKPIFALPYPPNSTSGVGCNGLIKSGGRLTESAEDIAAAFGLDLSPKKRAVALSADEEKLYGVLADKLSAHVNELALGAGIPPFKIRAVLSALEVKGLIVSLGGNRYAIV